MDCGPRPTIPDRIITSGRRHHWSWQTPSICNRFSGTLRPIAPPQAITENTNIHSHQYNICVGTEQDFDMKPQAFVFVRSRFETRNWIEEKTDIDPQTMEAKNARNGMVVSSMSALSLGYGSADVTTSVITEFCHHEICNSVITEKANS